MRLKSKKALKKGRALNLSQNQFQIRDQRVLNSLALKYGVYIGHIE